MNAYSRSNIDSQVTADRLSMSVRRCKTIVRIATVLSCAMPLLAFVSFITLVDLVTSAVLMVMCAGASAIAWRSRVGLLKFTREIAAMDRLDIVGPLAEVLELGDPVHMRGFVLANDIKSFKSAAVALKSLLPRITQADDLLLDKHQRTCLARAVFAATGSVAYTYDPDLAHVVLDTFVELGDKRAIKTARHLAALAGNTGAEVRARAAANEYLVELERRRKEERTSQILLRPTVKPLTDADSLLRPPSQEATSNSDALLRATISPELPS